MENSMARPPRRYTSLRSLSAELQLHIERRVVKAAPAYVVRHVVNVAPAEVFSRIARDNEVFYFLESSFFLHTP